jgi:2-methylcitrate dehydratase PrpD
LEAKFSIYHCVAAGLVFGKAGEKQFRDAVVQELAGLRDLVVVRTDPAVKTQQCDLLVRLKDGRTFMRHVENAIGSLENPMSDAALEAKFTDLANGILPPDRIQALIGLCWSLERSPDVTEIARAASA